MRYLILILSVLLLPSCSVEDDFAPLSIEPIYMDNTAANVLVDIIYVLPNEDYDKTFYNLNEAKYIDFLNGCFFNRHDIGITMGESKTIINPELFNLKDNQHQEPQVFSSETENLYKTDRLSIFIIPRSNTYGIAGLGLPHRLLITDEFLFTTTSPHEVGHSLGLTHKEIEGNIMCRKKPYLRKEFDEDQAYTMREKIFDLYN
ncbi:hypothetical protein M0D21_07185 [Aquimarina sp. D1M17]|uniref:hypothetical protein n=1 Tax=Aquimarina acroporae TaxID=2937283 RepID=UPI0020BD6944|nr:hypothetical protein [Aquimarina acroporae]MCK8521343.1 hypothetical protein [Aquimarina acroporae]